jgi:hypothetical protein
LTYCRSTYDHEWRDLASQSFVGDICPHGHMCKLHVYVRSHWCDECTNEILPGAQGKRCKHCQYDLCEACMSDDMPHPSSPLQQPTLNQLMRARTVVPATLSSPLRLPVGAMSASMDQRLSNVVTNFALTALDNIQVMPRGSRMKLRKPSSQQGPRASQQLWLLGF